MLIGFIDLFLLISYRKVSFWWILGRWGLSDGGFLVLMVFLGCWGYLFLKKFGREELGVRGIFSWRFCVFFLI